MRSVNVLDEVCEKEIPLYGNKAKNLWLMKKNGINIPATLAVKCPAAWGMDVTKEDVCQEIENSVKDHFSISEELIVRSSFQKEDTQETSMAGVFESVRVKSYEQVKSAACQVLDSAGKDWRNMGIIIQPYIDCDFSGIMFSVSPYDTGKNIVIEFADTSCSRLVKGDITPDLYVKNRGWIRENPGYVSESVIRDLTDSEERLRKLLNANVDVEFCVSEETIIFLQVRPMTTGKIKIPLDSVKNIEGIWILQEELSLPFTPLIRTLDPSGLLTERPHIIIKNYAYFSSEFRLKSIDDEKWKDWDSISEHYLRIFQDLLDKKEKSDIEMLEYAVQSYRSAVESYMNVNWFIYRRASYQELIGALKEKFENYQDVFFSVMHSIDTINTNKRKDFIKLLQNKGSSDFNEKKALFLKKYGAETSHPFYIMCKSLADYLEQIIDIIGEREINEEASGPLYNSGDFDENICVLIERYRKVVQRTEDDDYLLCLGSYVIRNILQEIEGKLNLQKDSIWFYEFDELKDLSEGKEVSSNVIDLRRKSFEWCKNYDMPLVIKDGVGIYASSESKSTLEGVTVSQGYTSGKVYVLKNPGDIFEIVNIPSGSIVYSNWISPVLSAYFFNIKGLIIPESSILSHGAILAREMHIPAVGGINYRFEDGMEIQLNATEGKVYIG